MSTPQAQPALPPSDPQQAQVLPPAQPAQSAAYANFTQIQSYVPPNVWTTDALLDYHEKQKEVILDNNRIFSEQQRRIGYQSWAGIGMVGIIVLVGLYLAATGNPFGEKLIGATLAFLAGYLAGLGKVGIK